VRLIADVDRERMPQFLSGSDLFVLGSRHEACGLALVEALASGVWPVVPDIPAFRTITGNGVSGTLWTAADAGSLSGVLVTAARQRTGQQARLRAWFERHLSWSAVGRKALEAYEQIYGRLS
jgi:glycosyltransferase involved in cell wall biosynthesis